MQVVLSNLFEVNHDVFRQLHVFEHPLQFAGEGCSTFCKWQNKQIKNQMNKYKSQFILFLIHLAQARLSECAEDKRLNGPCFSFDSMDFSASTEALFPTSNLLAKSFL